MSETAPELVNSTWGLHMEPLGLKVLYFGGISLLVSPPSLSLCMKARERDA